MTYSSNFDRALAYAAFVHRLQLRKGSAVPYIGHLLGTASIVIDAGGTETEAIAALLHDAVEDHGGAPRLKDIDREFGPDVASIVAACSDSLSEDPNEKAPWQERKAAYLAHLRTIEDPSIYLVSAADKLYNLRAILIDYRDQGDAFWKIFKAGRDGVIAYYGSLIDIYGARQSDARLQRVARELGRTYAALQHAVAEETATPASL